MNRKTFNRIVLPYLIYFMGMIGAYAFTGIQPSEWQICLLIGPWFLIAWLIIIEGGIKDNA